MINRLRATQRDGAAAIVAALGRENIANLAEKLGYARKHQVAHLKEIATGGVEPTTEELVQLCAVVSVGILRYDETADAVVTDAGNALRGALIGRDLPLLERSSRIPTFILERFLGGEDCLSVEKSDELVLHLFPGMKIDHETNTLVSRGYIQHPESSFQVNRNPHLRILNPDTPPRFDLSLNSNEVPVPIGVFAPVAQGSVRIEGSATILKQEKRGDWLKRVFEREKTVS
ncbi:hypothetical protein HFO99_30550 [Rhizobium leguminosarum]|uniref:hypothetical protein n=1 Tax=Rhizobium leguminosarum TaxID=384 RepID=UPI001C941120|nr:hypothetical protein [Rhizobium leguminosarum]MBY5338197.1 hypothetical protein [Rhizobium leguminosarum]